MQEGAFAIALKSKYFPGECVASRRGSPLLVGIKTKTRLATDHIPILYGKGKLHTYIHIDKLLNDTDNIVFVYKQSFVVRPYNFLRLLFEWMTIVF